MILSRIVGLAMLAFCIGACDSGPPPAPDYSNGLALSDPELMLAVRQAILKPTGDILPADIAPLKWLDARGLGITDLYGIGGLTGLTELILSANEIVDISPLAALKSLELLYINNNEITDISALAGLTTLVTLDLAGNEVESIAPLRDLTALTLIYAANNQIEDISALAGLTSLQILHLSGNRVHDISVLSNLISLNTLLLGNNRVDDVSALVGLTALNYLDLSGNQIDDIAALVDNGGLKAFDTVYLNDNTLEGQAALAQISALETRQVTVIK